jgi:hypothetical protein
VDNHLVAMNSPHLCSPAEFLCIFDFHPFTISS